MFEFGRPSAVEKVRHPRATWLHADSALTSCKYLISGSYPTSCNRRSGFLSGFDRFSQGDLAGALNYRRDFALNEPSANFGRCLRHTTMPGRGRAAYRHGRRAAMYGHSGIPKGGRRLRLLRERLGLGLGRRRQVAEVAGRDYLEACHPSVSMAWRVAKSIASAPLPASPLNMPRGNVTSTWIALRFVAD